MNADQARAVIFDVLAGIAPEADPTAVDPNELLVEELDIDSMDMLNLALGINRETGIEIPERDYSRLTTLREIVDYLVAARV